MGRDILKQEISNLLQEEAKPPATFPQEGIGPLQICEMHMLLEGRKGFSKESKKGVQQGRQTHPTAN